MTATSYNDISTANSVKILNKFSKYDDYIMLYTEIDSHIEHGDRVYITVVGDIGDLSQDSIILDNIYSSNIDSLYNNNLQGYRVIYVDKSKNAVVINKKITDITENGDISFYTIENQYISKISIHNIIVDSCTINGATIKYGIINNTKIDGNVNWIQGNIFGGEIYNIILDNKYDNSYITLKKFDSMSYIFMANNTELGLSDGYSYFYNTLIQDSVITNGNYIDCNLQNSNSDILGNYYINGGVFYNCNYVGYDINNGYHKNIIYLDKCNWNNGFFDCPLSGYSFKLDYWYNGTFVNGLFGGTTGQICYKPIWKNGIFNNGVFDSYRWENGEFNNGIFGASGKIGNKTTSTYTNYESHLGITKRRSDGNLLDATTGDNIYEYTTFLNGIINGGFFIRTKITNATIGNGTIADSTILNAKNQGGLMIDCSIKTGEIISGYIRSNFLSTVMNDCTIYDTNINIFNPNEDILIHYKSNSPLVKQYINAYSLYYNTETKIFINGCYLVSPILRITEENSKRIFINKQKYINGGIFENITFVSPQVINGGYFNKCYFEYTNHIPYNGVTGLIPNSVFCSVRPAKVLSNNQGVGGYKEYTMFEYSNNGYKNTFTDNIDGTLVNLYGFVYTKLANNGTGNNVIYDKLTASVLKGDNFYDPRKFNETTTRYDNIVSNTESFVILDIEYEDYMFGDFGILYLDYNGVYSDYYIINGGNFQNSEFLGLNKDNYITINNGVFDNSNFNGFIKILSCNFNGGKISGNSNEWYGGNFNSGIFGVYSQTNETYVLQLINGPKSYFLNINDENQQIDTINGSMTLDSIYPLIIRKKYTENNNFDSIGQIHDEEYQEYFLDIWNETGIDFTGATTSISNETPWDNALNEYDNYLLVPSHFVFVIKNTTPIDYNNMLSFIQKRTNIDVFDVRAKKAYNEIYNQFYEGKPVNDFMTEFVGYYTNERTYSIAVVFKFNKIEELYNNTLNKNHDWFNNIFRDYNLYYKNVWSDANAGYFSRPMPVYGRPPLQQLTSIDITSDYGSYPVPMITGLYHEGSLPAPWHFDNNGKLWLPFHQDSIKQKYQQYKSAITNYSNKYFGDTSEILPLDYFNFRKSVKSPFNSYLPSTKDNRKDYVTDSIEMNSNIGEYVNMNMGDKNILQINSWIYKGGWEDYIDEPIKFKTKYITNIEQSWLYIDQFFGIDTNLLNNSMTKNNRFVHVVSHDENFISDFAGPCRILGHSNVMELPSKYRIKIDKKISNNYGHAFIVDTNNFIFDNTNKILFILGFNQSNNYKITQGNVLYVYTPNYRGKVTIAQNGTMNSSGQMEIRISENISIPTTQDENFVYGLDSWTIDTSKTPDSISSIVQRLDINQETSHYNTGFDGAIIPSNKKNNRWVANHPLFIYSEAINTVYSPEIKNIYKNGYVQGKIIKIKNIKECYDGMYLYDTIFDYNINKEADKVNAYLYDSINTPDYNKVWLKDSVDINVTGNSLDFDQDIIMLDGYKKLSGTVIHYRNIFTFKKTTNLFRIEADGATSPLYLEPIQKMVNNKDFVEIHDESSHLLSGVYDSSSNGYSINIESYTKKNFPIGQLFGNFYTYSLRTLPIDYTISTFASSTVKKRGNYLEFSETLSNTVLLPALQIQSNGVDTIIKMMCDLRDSYYGKIMNIQNYKNSDVAIIAKSGSEYIYYSGKLTETRSLGNNYDTELTIILNKSVSELSKIEFGCLYVKEQAVPGLCYQYYTSTEAGKEITENDNFHYNSGDPTKPKDSPKQILMNLNNRYRTSETMFERQAGIIIESTYNLNNSEEIKSDIFHDGNFYSGVFNGEWKNGDWFADASSFKGTNYYNKEKGLDFTVAPTRKESTIKNFTEIINSLIKRGEYFMYPPWTNKERQKVITQKISRSDEY